MLIFGQIVKEKMAAFGEHGLTIAAWFD